MKSLPTDSPQSAAKVARASRKRGVKPRVPTEGDDWIEARDKSAIEFAEKERKEQEAKQRRADLMETAHMLLAVYCQSNSIDDAECQRIADRINYENSEKDHSLLAFR